VSAVVLFVLFCFTDTNRTPAERWTAEQTRVFYKGLGEQSNATQQHANQRRISPLSSLLRGNSLREILLGGDSFVVVVVLTCLRDGVMSSGIFGSDFSMIGKVLFHGNRDRRQVKNKFKRCETFQKTRQALRF
jgi:hypothetical protein